MSYKSSFFLGILVVAIVTILMVIYASYLNEIFYFSYAPFADSSGYLLRLLKVIEWVKQDGFYNAFEKVAFQSGPSVILPFLEAVLLAPMVKQPSRALGTLIQLPWLSCFAISLFVYFRCFRNQTTVSSILLSIPFVSISSIWNYNGGLSDFRMDLLLYLLLGTSFVWFLASRYSKSYWTWGLTGLFLGLTCLARATAPVYIFICLAPLLFLRLISFKSISLRRTLLGICIIFGLVFIISGWFYYLQFNSLYQYYFVWNTDANAGLPLVESIKHFWFAIESIGPYVLYMATFFSFFGLLNYFLSARHTRISLLQPIFLLDWESFWLGIAPITFLVFRGAGLNPFVVMPAAFGLIMFLISPYLIDSHYKIKKNNSRVLVAENASTTIACLFISILFILSALTGIDSHLKPSQGKLFRHMKPLQLLVQEVAGDVDDRGEVVMASSYFSYVNDVSLENILRFDFPELDSVISFPEMAFPPTSFNSIQSLSDWENIPGSDDKEKIDYLVALANRKFDYIILPTDFSVKSIQAKLPFIKVNYYIGEIKDRLLDLGEWFPIGEPKQIDHDEIVQVYRNKRLGFRV